MSTINFSTKKTNNNQTNIFAHRNTNFKKTIYQHRNTNSSHQTRPKVYQTKNKFMIFKDRLASYLQDQKIKQDLSSENCVFWNKAKQKSDYQKQARSINQNVPAVNYSQKQSILSNLRKSCKIVQKQKSLSNKLDLAKTRIHANFKKARKRNSTEPATQQPFNPDIKYSWFERNPSLPVCTINYLSKKKYKQQNKTVYNSYLSDKLGCDQLNLSGVKRKSSHNYVPIYIGSQKFVDQGYLTKQRNCTEVLIIGHNDELQDYKNKAQKILGSRKPSNTFKKHMIKIGQARDVENMVGPWSKNQQEQVEQHFTQ